MVKSATHRGVIKAAKDQSAQFIEPCSERATQLDSTEQSELLVVTQFSCGHMMSTPIPITWAIGRNVWREQKMYMEIKWSCWKERLFRVAIDMDIHGYIHMWISDLGHDVDASTDMWYQCLISDTGMQINDFTVFIYELVYICSNYTW